MRDPLHQAAVADEDVRAVIDDRVPGAVEFGREELLRERHADGVGEPLAQRAGRRLDAGRQAVLGVAGRLRMELTEALDLLDRKVVAGEVQQRVQQHRAVAVRDHEAVAVRPSGVRRIVRKVAVPQRDGDFGHAHRHAGMAALRGFDGVHRQSANRVREQRIGGAGFGGRRGHRHFHGSVSGESDAERGVLARYRRNPRRRAGKLRARGA